jgi:hypothetical protein
VSSDESEVSDGALEAAEQLVDPFTKIPFHPHKGIMTFAPIRPGVLKEIGAVTESPDATETGTS